MSAGWTLQQVADACARAGGRLPMPERESNGAVFAEPWQAQVFALTLLAHERGLFSWPQWATALSERLAAARQGGEVDDGTDYYRHWTDALEDLLIRRGVATPEQIHRLEHAWEAAAERTPHGQPIRLGASDLTLLD